MLPIRLSFRLIPNLASPERRAVGFLEGHSQLNAGQVFDNLRAKDRDRLMSYMDRWCNGMLGPKTYFHNFENESYRECMVFKLNDNRFYGFKCNPLPESRSAFLLCVLNIHAYKREHETDKAELDRVNDWHASPPARIAITKAYPEYGRMKCKPLRN